MRQGRTNSRSAVTVDRIQSPGLNPGSRPQAEVDHRVGDVAQRDTALASVIAEQLERRVHRDLPLTGDQTLGLLDDDPAVQGLLELLGRVPDVVEPGGVGDSRPQPSACRPTNEREPEGDSWTDRESTYPRRRA
jgi:hypothetical protein